MGRSRTPTDPVADFVAERTRDLRGSFSVERTRVLVNTVAHQAVAHFTEKGSKITLPKPPLNIGRRELERLGKVQYDDFQYLAGKAMRMVSAQPDIDVDTVVGHCVTKYLSTESGTSLAPADFYLRVAALSTAYEYAAQYAHQNDYQQTA